MATRCTTSQQFIETFHRFCDESSFFVATVNMRPVGLETPFSIQLADKTPVLRGLCVVLAAWTTAENQYKRPGIRLGIRRLTPESEAVFYQLQAMRTTTSQELEAEALVEVPAPPPHPLPPIPPRAPPSPRPATAAPAPTPASAPKAVPAAMPVPSIVAPRAVPPAAQAVAPTAVVAPPATASPAAITRPPVATAAVAPLSIAAAAVAPTAVIASSGAGAAAVAPPAVIASPPVVAPSAAAGAAAAPAVIASSDVVAAAAVPPPAVIASSGVVASAAVDAVPTAASDPDPTDAHASAPPPVERTPGSELVLPANPLQHLTDESLVGFIDCTLYEETANFFRAMDDGFAQDALAPPPAPAPKGEFNPSSLADEPAHDVDPNDRSPSTTLPPPIAPPPHMPMPLDPSAIARPPHVQVPPDARPMASPPHATAVDVSAPAPEVLGAPPHIASSLEAPLMGRTATGELVPLARPTGNTIPVFTPAGERGAAPVVHDPAVQASLARVETSVARLLDVVDTSRPIDVVRVTPVPAGEAFVRPGERTSYTKWFAIGGAALAAILSIVLLVVTRPTKPAAKPAPEPEPVAKPMMTSGAVADTSIDKPAEPAPDKPVADVPKVDVDGDELAAVSENAPSSPVVGEGPCKLEVTTTPAGTIVQLDGQTVGPSPVTIAGPCTRRRVDLVHPRYKAEQRWVALAEGKPGSIDVTLQRPTHTLLVTSQPSGATVSIAGRRAGTTPTKVPLMGFSGIEVKIEKAGFDTVTKRVYSKVADDKLSVSLKRSLFLK